jgi:hypothetical protein
MLLGPVGRDHTVDDLVVGALSHGAENVLALGLVELVRQFINTLPKGAAHGMPELYRCLGMSWQCPKKRHGYDDA